MNEFLQVADVWLPGTIAMAVLTLASGFFSSSETALFYLSHEELRRFRMGSHAQRTVAGLLANPDRLLTAVLFWNLLINLMYFAVSVVVATQLTAAKQNAAAGVFGLLGLFLIILFGEVLPKSLAVVFRLPLSTLVAWPLAAAVRVLDPIIPALLVVTRSVWRAFWPDVVHEPRLDAVDLERAVETSPLGDEARRQERVVLHNVLDLAEITVEELLRPRGTYVTLKSPVSLADLRRRTPHFDYVLVRDADSNGDAVDRAIPLARFVQLPTSNLQNAAEEVVHVPWCATAAFTLQELRRRLSSVASVVNEYGETIGIVTYEDLVETVVVPEPSRTRRVLQREPVEEIEPGRFEAAGLTTLRYLAKKLGIHFDPTEDGYVTIAGLLQEELKELPEVGDSCTWQDHRLEVVSVGGRELGRVRITRRPPIVGAGS